MRERPIIFSAESVNAILAGRKAKTGRVIMPQPECWDFTLGLRCRSSHGFELRNGQIHCVDCGKQFQYSVSGQDTVRSVKCPFGVHGDKLWVREAFYHYESDIVPCTYYKTQGGEDVFKWKSPMFMPRKYSRLTLEIVNVRCERLKDILPCDIQKEGCPYKYSGFDPEQAPDWDAWMKYHWDALNAKRGYDWDSNPWVWVLEFKKAEGGTHE
jgi:hypothetical protein